METPHQPNHQPLPDEVMSLAVPAKAHSIATSDTTDELLLSFTHKTTDDWITPIVLTAKEAELLQRSIARCLQITRDRINSN